MAHKSILVTTCVVWIALLCLALFTTTTRAGVSYQVATTKYMSIAVQFDLIGNSGPTDFDRESRMAWIAAHATAEGADFARDNPPVMSTSAPSGAASSWLADYTEFAASLFAPAQPAMPAVMGGQVTGIFSDDVVHEDAYLSHLNSSLTAAAANFTGFPLSPSGMDMLSSP